ncbi:MAG TPA: hypothetical protein ENK57_11015, partial [Polyangiaceae bacterium]|nr:hypothetical protein [Polyangiaceae bacterium]
MDMGADELQQHLASAPDAVDALFERPYAYPLPSREVADLVVEHYLSRGGKKPSPAKIITLAGYARDVRTAKHVIERHLPSRLVLMKKHGFNSYHAAAISGDLKLLGKAADRGHDVRAVTGDFTSLFRLAEPLLLAIKFSNYAVADAIIEASPEAKTAFRTLQSLIRDGDDDGLEYLVAKGIDFSELSQHGRFVEPPDVATIDFLLAHGWDLSF